MPQKVYLGVQLKLVDIVYLMVLLEWLYTISPSNITDNFYVAYEFETEDPTIDDLIMKIDYRGLNIWDGGLNIFSDYYSGWRDSVHGTTID